MLTFINHYECYCGNKWQARFNYPVTASTCSLCKRVLMPYKAIKED